MLGRPPEKSVVSRQSELVIEGFPRSANTFSVAAFKYAQTTEVRLVSHLHFAAQIQMAHRWGVPCLVLIREPLSACTSLIIREPVFPPRMLLKQYIRFHRRISRLLDHVVVADFQEVTGDYGAVIQRINEFYGTTFDLFQHTPENVEAVFQSVEKSDQRDQKQNQTNERTVARPSADRKQMTDAAKQQFAQPKLAGLIQEASRWYELFRERTSLAERPHESHDTDEQRTSS